MTLLRLLPLLLLSLHGMAQHTPPNGRYYENLPHGRVTQDLEGMRAVYLPPGEDSIYTVAIVDDASSLLDTSATVYLPHLLDNLIAQGAIRPVAVINPAKTETGREAILTTLRRTGALLAEAVEWQPIAGSTAALVSTLRADPKLPEWIEGGVYRLPREEGNTVMFSGATAHFSDLVMERWRVASSGGTSTISEPDREQIFILREGEAQVEVGDSSWKLTAESVLFLAAGDTATVRPLGDDNLVAYHMDYPGSGGDAPEASFVVDYTELSFQPHDRGGLWNYFRRATPICPYYEMHKTQLNPGIKSHEPHVHGAAEIVIMIEGTTEMEIGDDHYSGEAGDVYYLPSQVPHAIRNTGESPCTYLAFQWDCGAGH